MNASDRMASVFPRQTWRALVRALILMVAAETLVPAPLAAVTLLELVTHSKLTPKKFASYFEDFQYEFAPEILPAETFLRRERGDCDDYAVLANYVLGRHDRPRG